MKASLRLIFTLPLLLFLSLNFSLQLHASDCGCDTTGAYVDPATGIAPDQIISSPTEAYSPNSIYKVVTGSSGGQTVLNLYKVEGNQLLLQLTFQGDAHWGFSPDDHRFAFWSVPNQTQQMIKLYNLENPSPKTPVLYETYTAGQGNEASVTFSPHGNYFIYALITGTSTTNFLVADSKTGEIKFQTDISYSTAPGLGGDTYGGGTWGFGPDKDDHTLMLAWLTSASQQLKWKLFNLSNPVGSTVVYDPSPFSVTSAYWTFSLCGDVIANVLKVAQNVNLRLIKTTDGTSSQLYTYGNVSIFLRTTSTQHQVKIGNNPYTDLSPPYPNMADTACSSGDVTPPSWPAGSSLTATSITNTSVSLEWTKAASDAVRYKLFMDDATLDSVDSNITTYLVNNLQPGTTYHFKIEATDAAGNYSSDGPALDVTTSLVDTEPPVWPDTTIYISHIYSSGNIKLYWTIATDNVRVNNYIVYLNDSVYNTITANNYSPFYYQFFNGLENNVTYKIKVIAEDDAGNKSKELSHTFTFNPDTVPVWPAEAQVEATDIGITKASLRWTRPYFDFSIIGYRICNLKDYCDDDYAQNDLVDADTTYTMENLEPDSTYTFYLTAYGDNYRYSDKSPQITFKTLPDTIPPEWPDGSQLTPCETGTDYITLRWDAAVDNVRVTNYEVYENNKLIKTIQNFNPGSVNYRVTGLQPGTTYTFRVVAGDKANNYTTSSLSVTEDTHTGEVKNPAFPNTSYSLKQIEGSGISLIDMNNNGQLVGFNSNTGLGFIWDNDSIKSLGTLGQQYSKPYFLNNNGDVAGEFLVNNGDYMPFFWRNDTMVGTGALSYSNWAVPTALNDSGTVVGWSRYASINTAGFQKAFRWTPNSIITDLGTLGGDKYIPYTARVESNVTDMNNKGQIVGYTPAVVDSQAVRHGFIWENGQMKDLNPSHYFYPFNINNNGDVLVTDKTANDGLLMVWHEGNSLVPVQQLDGHSSYGGKITDQGSVFGTSRVDKLDCDGLYLEHAFYWDGTKTTDLGTMGGNNSRAFDMNSKGQIVGEAETPNGILHAFLWQDGVMIDLNPDGFNESSAVKINDSGEVLINAYIYHDTIDYETGQTRTDKIEYGLLASPDTVPHIVIAAADTIHLCPGESFTVQYTVSNGSFNNDNEYVIQLSDPDSSFYDPLTIQTEKINNGILRGTLPVPFKWDNLTSGYFSIRIISNDPVSISNTYSVISSFGNCRSTMIIGSTGNSYCAGDSLQVPYIVSGNNFATGNNFKVILSDSNGDFSNGTVIGSIQDTTPGTIPASIPNDVVYGDKYKIEIEASDPEYVSQDNGFNITINQPPAAEISQHGDTLIASDGDTWIWTLNNNTLKTHTKSVIATENGDYRVVVFREGCAALSGPLSFNVNDVSSHATMNEIKISPNPGTGIFKIDVPAREKTGRISIKVYGISGELIKNKQWDMTKDEKTISLNLSDHPNGLYFIKIIIPDTDPYVQKIIIKH